MNTAAHVIHALTAYALAAAAGSMLALALDPMAYLPALAGAIALAAILAALAVACTLPLSRGQLAGVALTLPGVALITCELLPLMPIAARIAAR